MFRKAQKKVCSSDKFSPVGSDTATGFKVASLKFPATVQNVSLEPGSATSYRGTRGPRDRVPACPDHPSGLDGRAPSPPLPCTALLQEMCLQRGVPPAVFLSWLLLHRSGWMQPRRSSSLTAWGWGP